MADNSRPDCCEGCADESKQDEKLQRKHRHQRCHMLSRSCSTASSNGPDEGSFEKRRLGSEGYRLSPH